MASAEATEYRLARSLRAAERRDEPYRHWLLSDLLDRESWEALMALPISIPAGLDFNGTREANNQSRIYFNPPFRQAHPVAEYLAAAFDGPALRGVLAEVTGRDLSADLLRIEYTLDTDGFWLEPHVDIAVKRFTMLIYLSDDPALADSGTDIYDGDLRPVGRAPYGPGLGLIFLPAKDSWHGFSRRPIRGLRRSLIINYVTADWRARHELARG